MSSWTKIAHQTLGSAGTLTADWSSLGKNYRHLKVRCWIKNAGNGNAICYRFNDDTGSNYGSKRKFCSTGSHSVSTGTSTTFMNSGMDSHSSDHMLEMDIANPSGNFHKLTIGSVSGWKDDVVGFEFRGRWQGGNQINKITCKLEFAVNIASGSHITVWGADDNATTPIYPNLPKGIIFEDTSDGKHYMWDGVSAWNEIT